MKLLLSAIAGVFVGVILVFSVLSFFKTRYINKTPEGPISSQLIYKPEFILPDSSLVSFKEFDYKWELVSKGEIYPGKGFESKVLFLNFWATWCAPCLEEFYSIEALVNKIDNPDINFVFVSSEDSSIVSAFERENNFGLEFYSGTENFHDKNDVVVLPTTIIVDRRGVIRYRHIGVTDWQHNDVMVFLNQLLSEN